MSKLKKKKRLKKKHMFQELFNLKAYVYTQIIFPYICYITVYNCYLDSLNLKFTKSNHHPIQSLSKMITELF